MLVLTRRIGEEIVISGDIRVAVLQVSGQKVRLGITAPSFVGVVRQELLARGSNTTASATLATNGLETLASSEEPL